MYGGNDNHGIASWAVFSQYMKTYKKVYADQKGECLT